MDTTASVRATGPTTPVVARPEPAPMRQTARTELPASETVVASAETADVRLDLSNIAQRSAEASRQAEVSRKLELDDDSKELVYRVSNERTGQVLQQIPDEALLRLRAYVQAQAARREQDGEAHKVERVA
jgi:uncharacterized FlaG/YvyC family protein